MSAFPQGWVPIRIYPRERDLWVDWCDLGADRFDEPFFDSTIEACLRRPFNQLFRPQTPIAALGEGLAETDAAPPAGFVFHLSRCGSTLVAQMLAHVPQNIVISEASPIDAVLRARIEGNDVSEELRIRWLRQLLARFGQRRFGERHLFVKLDCWHILRAGLLRRAFPDVPWIFLYRDPLEVLVSQLKMRAAYMVPGMIGADFFGIDPAAALAMPPAEYCARVLASLCDAAIAHAGVGGGLLVNYRDLPDAVADAILPHFGIDCSDADHALMTQAAGFNAKTPSLPFVADGASKREAATEAARAAAEQWLMPRFRALEALRAKEIAGSAQTVAAHPG